MTISSSPVGQNSVQVYVFVREHQHFCHSSFVYKKKRRAFALLSLQANHHNHNVCVFSGVVLRFLLVHEAALLLLGPQEKVELREKKKFFLNFVLKIFLKNFFEVRPCRSIFLDYSTSFILLLLQSYVTIPLSEFHATPGGVASRVL